MVGMSSTATFPRSEMTKRSLVCAYQVAKLSIIAVMPLNLCSLLKLIGNSYIATMTVLFILPCWQRYMWLGDVTYKLCFAVRNFRIPSLGEDLAA